MSRYLKQISAFVCVVLVLFFSWPHVKAYIFDVFVQTQKKQELLGIGQKIDPQFKLRDRDGKEVEIGERFSKGLVIMVYSSACPPCQKAAFDSEQRLKQSNLSEESRFIVLQFSDKLDGSLMALERTSVFLSNLDRNSSPFAGTSTPTFYVVDKQGVLKKKQIGWYEGIVDELLQTLDAARIAEI